MVVNFTKDKKSEYLVCRSRLMKMTSLRSSNRKVSTDFSSVSFDLLDWPVPSDGTGKKWTENWEDADWDDEDPDDNFQQKLRDEIKKALERNQSPQKAK
jgi:hypothetical protein